MGHIRFTVLFLLIFLAPRPFSWAQEEAPLIAPVTEPRVLQSVEEIRMLRYEDAKAGPPVLLEVTVISHLLPGFDGQDDTGGLYFEFPKPPPVGTKVLISGNVTGGLYEPYVIVDSWEERGPSPHPVPLILTPDHLQSGEVDNLWVEATGLLMNPEIRSEQNRWAQATLVTSFAELKVRFRNHLSPFLASDLEQLSKARVRLRGSGAPLFNDSKQRIGLELVCPALEFVEVLEPPPSPDDLPITHLSEIRSWNYLQSQPGFVRTQGVVTLIDEDKGQLVIQYDNATAPVSTPRFKDATLGSSIEVIGLPTSLGYFVGLHLADFSVAESDLPVPVAILDPSPLSRKHPFRLVTIEGRIAEKTGRFISLQTDANTLIPVHSSAQVIADFPPPGTEVAVTGVKWIEAEANGEIRSIALELRDKQDLRILSAAPWWTPARYLMAIGLLVLVVLTFLTWSTVLRRQVRRQTQQIQEQIETNATLEERNRIAREPHDTLSQGFAGVAYQLSSVRNHLQSAPEKAGEKLNLAIHMVEHSLAEARRSLQDLRSPLLQEHSLGTALQTSAEELCAADGIALKPQISEDASPLPEATRHEILRIALEAITNAIRHASPSTIWVELEIAEGSLSLQVRDDGTGFHPEEWTESQNHFGLRGMQERANRIQAQLKVTSTPKKGSVVVLHLTT